MSLSGARNIFAKWSCKMMSNVQDIDIKSTEINRKKVQITTGAKTIEKLKKGIEDAIVERTKCNENKENKANEFKAIEKLAFDVQEKYNETEQVTLQLEQEPTAAVSNKNTEIHPSFWF